MSSDRQQIWGNTPGVAVLLKCLQYESRFPRSRQEVAPEVVRFLAIQVGVDATLFAQYAWEGRTIETHRAQIREMAKIREFRRSDEEALLDWLCTEILAFAFLGPRGVSADVEKR